MPDRYTGKDVKITLGPATVAFQSIEVQISANKWEAPASDTKVRQGGSGMLTCTMTIKGWESSNSASFDFGDIAAYVLSGQPPSALSWTDTATTPATRFPPNFSTLFPLSSMRIDSVTGGSGGPDKPSEWSVSISCGNLDAPFSTT